MINFVHKQEAHGALRRLRDYTFNVIVTKVTPLSTPPGAQWVVSKYFLKCIAPMTISRLIKIELNIY